MYKKEYYNEWMASMNALVINNNHDAYIQTKAIFSTRYKRDQTDDQVYKWIKPRLDNIIYHGVSHHDVLRRYRGWKHDLAKYLVENDYNDFKEWQKVSNERTVKNG